MNTFINAMNNRTRTTNAAAANISTESAVLDLFFKMGAARTKSEVEITNWFAAAFTRDRDLAMRALFYNRDIRGGQGERRSFRAMFRWLCVNHPDLAALNVPNVAFYGRFDDLDVTLGTLVWPTTVVFVMNELRSGNKLAFKWMPREGKKRDRVAKAYMEAYRLTPRKYRKLIARQADVVETLMCDRKWYAINYEHVPSKAMTKYRKAFSKRDPDRFVAYLGAVEKGAAKINAATLFPSDLVKKYLVNRGGTDRVVDAQWAALPDYSGFNARVLVVADVSGSMSSPRQLPLSASIGLGLYFSERLPEPFKNVICTFSERPEFVKLTATRLSARIRELGNANWSMNTNFEAVFAKLLSRAVAAHLSEDQMPQMILVVSDMQFDAAKTSSFRGFDMVRAAYNQAGYRVPDIVFWNVNTHNNVPATINEHGVALVSGYSPAVVKAILSCEMNPLAVMEKALRDPRYDRVIS